MKKRTCRKRAPGTEPESDSHLKKKKKQHSPIY
jgi:hypothetical protein